MSVSEEFVGGLSLDEWLNYWLELDPDTWRGDDLSAEDLVGDIRRAAKEILALQAALACAKHEIIAYAAREQDRKQFRMDGSAAYFPKSEYKTHIWIPGFD